MYTNAAPALPSARESDLRRTVFLPLAGTLVLLVLALGATALWAQKRSERDRLERKIEAAVRLFQLRLAGDAETMKVAMEPMLSDPAILDRYLAGDPEGLLQTVQPRFDVLSAHGISRMNFVDTNMVTFLRVHRLEQHGDVTDRITLREAQQTGGPADGLELERRGMLALRVVIPLRHEGRVVGYFEVGREVDSYARDIRRTLSIDMSLLVRKDRLVPKEWAKGQVRLGRAADWERFDEFVPTSSAHADEGFAVVDEAAPSIAQTVTEPERIELADGRHLAIGARPLLDGGGREVGLIVVSVDVTESGGILRRTLAWFFAAFVVFGGAMLLLLYRIVYRAERDLREAKAQLCHAQKMEVIGQLTGGMAHDFNNLLAVIMSDLENLRDRLAADEFEELLAGAWEATERGAALVARLLAVSRKQPLSPSSLDANQLVGDLMPLLERAVTSNIVIRAEYGPNLWKCFVDASQLENLILNLVVNGRDAMPEGGGLTIETSNQCVSPREAHEWAIAPGDYVKLTVTDTGTGMPREVLERAFDPFFTTKEVGKGSGLGLSMVHGTAKQSGGHVLLESTLGVGTRVRLLLPRACETRETRSASLPTMVAI